MNRVIDPPPHPDQEILPPNYATAIRDQPQRLEPQDPVIYRFTSWAQGSMLLIPPREAENQQPLYRITVKLDLNPFLPVSYITRVFRCGVEDGELVGEFGLALNKTRAVLQIGDTTTLLASALHLINGTPKYFNWNVKNRFRWDCRVTLSDGSPMCICYAYLPSLSTTRSHRTLPDAIQVATFVPSPEPLVESTLTIFPVGHRLMDEILVSSLVVVRMLNQ